jgi:gentisate 1,2-dioxygenase
MRTVWSCQPFLAYHGTAFIPVSGASHVTSERTAKLASQNFWNELLALRDRQRDQRKSAVQVVRLSELPLESNEQGLMRWYLHPAITDTVLSTLSIYRQEIPPGSRSGRLKFQGGQILFIVEGRGHTMLDGVKHAWEAGDVVNLPCKRDGIVVQHFNDDAQQTAIFMAVEPNLFAATSVDRGCGFHQLEQSPDFRRPAAE